MKLDSAQQERVSENLKLVHKVIHDRVHNPNQVGIFTYDDLYQIGCIGLCKAAATDKGGVFPHMHIALSGMKSARLWNMPRFGPQERH